MTIVNFCFSKFFEICLCCLCLQYRCLPICFSIIFLKYIKEKTTFSISLSLILFSFWILLSCCWSPDQLASVFKALSTITILLVGTIGYKNYTFSYNKKTLTLTFLSLVVFIMIEYLTKATVRQSIISIFSEHVFNEHFNISFYNRALTGLSISFWPIWSLIKKPLQKWVFLSFFTVFIIYSPSETSAVSFVLGLVGYTIIRHRYLGQMLFWGIQCTLFLSMPAMKFLKYLENYKEKIPHSLWHRFKIWEYFQYNIEQKILSGWGMDAAHILSRQQLFSDQFEVSAVHPHNFVLQLWFELGFIGVVLVSSLLTVLFRSIQHLPLERLRFLYAQIITAFVMSLSAFGFWQTWWLILLWISAYLSKAVLVKSS